MDIASLQNYEKCDDTIWKLPEWAEASVDFPAFTRQFIEKYISSNLVNC